MEGNVQRVTVQRVTVQTGQGTRINTHYLTTIPGIMKIIEIILAVIIISILRGSNASFGSQNASYFAFGTLMMALVITPLLLICYLMGRIEIQKSILEPALNFLLFVFLLSAGCVCINFWQHRYGSHEGISETAGSLCIIASIAYFVDFIFSVLNYRN